MKVNLQRRSEIGEERRRRTLEKILRAMVFVLSDKKFEDVNIEDFIEPAGISRGTFYNYFNNKDDIAFTIATLFNSVIENTIASIAPKATKPVDKIALSLVTFLDFAAKAPNLAEVMFREFLRNYPRFPTFVESTAIRAHEQYRAATAEGAINIFSPEVLQDATAGTLSFLIVRTVYAPKKEQRSIMRQGVIYILQGQGVTKAKAKAATDKAMSYLPIAALESVDQSIDVVIDLLLNKGLKNTDGDH